MNVAKELLMVARSLLAQEMPEKLLKKVRRETNQSMVDFTIGRIEANPDKGEAEERGPQSRGFQESYVVKWGKGLRVKNESISGPVSVEIEVLAKERLNGVNFVFFKRTRGQAGRLD